MGSAILATAKISNGLHLMETTPNSQFKWHQKPVAVVLMLIFFWPLGLYFMWANGMWSATTRWVLTIALLLVTIVGLSGRTKNSGPLSADDNSSGSSGSSISPNGGESCGYAVKERVESIGHIFQGAEYKGDGWFLVMASNLEATDAYYVARIHVNGDCEVDNVDMQ